MGEFIDASDRFAARRVRAESATERLWDAHVEPLHDYGYDPGTENVEVVADVMRNAVANLACKEVRTPVEAATQAIVDYHRAIAYGFTQSDIEELEGIKDAALELLTEDTDRVIALERSLDIIAQFEDEMHSLHNPGY